jgi:methylated-DNA-protein-cysteine methyltransferase related protein
MPTPSSPTRKPKPSTYQQIYAVVSLIPKGKVATYGQIALLAGLPRSARFVGYALSALTERSVPWHRVVNARGEISARADGSDAAAVQRLRLEKEGVLFDSHGRIDLRRCGWRPEAPLFSPEGS